MYPPRCSYPFAAHIEHAAAIAADDPPVRRLDKLERWLDATGGTRDSAPLFAALLSIPFSDRYGPLDLSPPAQREKTLQALEEQLTRLAETQPVLGMFEDAHWIDPTSRTLLERLVDLVPRLRALLLVTARPDFAASWARLPHVTVLTLNHLGRAEAARLIAQIARGQALSAALVDGIVERAEGIPLYVEEITKATLERHDERDPGDRIPPTLRDSLTGRLDRLGWVKEVAQAAAVIGREFDDELLASITTVSDERRHDALRQLSRAQLVVERRHPARTVHYFRHALIQEAAYQSLLNVTRRGYHKHIAEAIEARFPDRAQSEPETLAQHFTEAGDDGRAITYWLRAGQRAAQRSANLEAVEHLHKGQQLLERRAAGKERDELELSLLIALGPALMATRGWNAPEVEAVYSRARALAAERGRSTDVFPAVWGRWLVAHAGGQAQLARDLLAELFTLLCDTSDAHLLLQAHHAGASTTCTDGELAASMEHFEAVRRLYRLDEHREQALVYGGHDPCVCALSMGALVQLMRGDFRRSRTLSDDALALAARVGHAPSVAHAALYRAELSHILGDVTEAEARAHEIFAVASEKGIAHYAAWALMFLGWTMVKRGAIDAGLAKTDEGHAALLATGNQYHIPQRLTLRAETLAAAGRTNAARDAMEEALESLARTAVARLGSGRAVPRAGAGRGARTPRGVLGAARCRCARDAAGGPGPGEERAKRADGGASKLRGRPRSSRGRSRHRPSGSSSALKADAGAAVGMVDLGPIPHRYCHAYSGSRDAAWEGNAMTRFWTHFTRLPPPAVRGRGLAERLGILRGRAQGLVVASVARDTRLRTEAITKPDHRGPE
jgi:hypothetical protein